MKSHPRYGTSAPGGTPSISCDGKVPGSTFDATHWTGSETPDDIYADTSTEIALNLARARAAGRYEELDDAIAVNNHFDVDGVLSAWACCDPDAALPHAELLADAAAAGDFGEWPSDDGVKLCLAVEALEDDTADEGYSAALAALPGLVEDVDARADLWGDGWESIRDGWEAVGDGGASVDDGAGRIALVSFCRANLPKTSCGDAVAATWIFRGTELRRRRGRDVDIPSRPAHASGTSPHSGACRLRSCTERCATSGSRTTARACCERRSTADSRAPRVNRSRGRSRRRRPRVWVLFAAAPRLRSDASRRRRGGDRVCPSGSRRQGVPRDASRRRGGDRMLRGGAAAST